jgi:hypothetical protein
MNYYEEPEDAVKKYEVRLSKFPFSFYTPKSSQNIHLAIVFTHGQSMVLKMVNLLICKRNWMMSYCTLNPCTTNIKETNLQKVLNDELLYTKSADYKCSTNKFAEETDWWLTVHLILIKNVQLINLQKELIHDLHNTKS